MPSRRHGAGNFRSAPCAGVPEDVMPSYVAIVAVRSFASVITKGQPGPEDWLEELLLEAPALCWTVLDVFNNEPWAPAREDLCREPKELTAAWGHRLDRSRSRYRCRSSLVPATVSRVGADVHRALAVAQEQAPAAAGSHGAYGTSRDASISATGRPVRGRAGETRLRLASRRRWWPQVRSSSAACR